MNQYIRAEAFAFFALFFAISIKVYAFENLKSLKFSKKKVKNRKNRQKLPKPHKILLLRGHLKHLLIS